MRGRKWWRQMEEGCRGKGREGGGGERQNRERSAGVGGGEVMAVQRLAPPVAGGERESQLCQTQREVQTARQTALLPNRKLGLATGQFNVCPHLTCSLHPPEQRSHYNRADREERRGDSWRGGDVWRGLQTSFGVASGTPCRRLAGAGVRFYEGVGGGDINNNIFVAGGSDSCGVIRPDFHHVHRIP